MPVIPVADLDDPRIRVYRHIKATNETRDLPYFVVEGVKLVERLFESRYSTRSVLATDREAASIASKTPENVPLFVVPRRLIHELVGFNFHQGVLGCGERSSPPDLDDLLDREGPRSILVVCPRLDNPENLGAIVRISDVFGITAVLVGGRCPDPLSRRVLRVSMGTSLRLPVLAFEDLETPILRLRERFDYRLVAAIVHGDAESLREFPRPDRLALFLGSESAGLEPAWVEFCDRKLTIPMRPGAESLNVAAAAAILLHQLSEW